MAGPGARPSPGASLRLRIDKWLWQARFFRSRVQAAELVGGGQCRVNGNRIVKPGYGISAGDVLTFVQAGRVRVVRVEALGQRRGPASEALGLYSDLAPLPEDETPSPLE